MALNIDAWTCCCLSSIPTGSVGVRQFLGEYQGWQEPGLSCICFPCATVQSVSLAVNQLTCKSECKTKDNVTVLVVTAVQYRILKDMVKVATFDIASPLDQIRAEVDNVLRSTMPIMTLDESYEAKERMVGGMLVSVRKAMGQYGYDILNVLITDIRPEKSVLDAMNEINASRRRREAAFEKGEAEKLLRIEASEADAEAKRLAGVGMANMRAAMARGFQDSMKFMKDSGMSEKEAVQMMIMTQYLDTLREFAGSHGSIVVPYCGGPFKSSQKPQSSQQPKPQTPRPPKKKKRKKKKSTVPAGASSDSANYAISDPAAGRGSAAEGLQPPLCWTDESEDGDKQVRSVHA